MRTLKSILNIIYRVFASFNGSIIVSRSFNHSKPIGSLRVITIDDYVIEVYCYKRQYLFKKARSIFGDKNKIVYDLSCRIEGSAPEILLLASELKVTLPPLVPSFVDEDYHLKILVNAYLDILKHELLLQIKSK